MFSDHRFVSQPRVLNQDKGWGGGNWKTEGGLELKLRVELGVGGRSGVEGVRGVEGVVGSKST